MEGLAYPVMWRQGRINRQAIADASNNRCWRRYLLRWCTFGASSICSTIHQPIGLLWTAAFAKTTTKYIVGATKYALFHWLRLWFRLEKKRKRKKNVSLDLMCFIFLGNLYWDGFSSDWRPMQDCDTELNVTQRVCIYMICISICLSIWQ